MARHGSADGLAVAAPRHAARPLALAALLALAPAAPAALLALDEAAMSDVNARDGIEVQLNDASTMSLSQLKWVTDSGAAAFGACTGGVANQHACTLVNSSTLDGVGGPLQITGTFDTGASAQTGGTVGITLGATWQPLLLALGGLTINTPTANYSANSIGSIGIVSQGSLKLSNVSGLFNGSGNLARLNFSSLGDIIYRQGNAGSPELSFGNFQLTNRFTNGAAGGQLDSVGQVSLDNQGLLVSAPFAKADLLFDLMFKSAPANYDTAGRSPIILFGWSGGLVNPAFRLSPGGVAYGTYACGAYTCYDYTGTNGGGARSEGVNLTASWDFDSDFSWVLGQAGGNRTQVRFSNWRRMGPASAVPMLSMPITFDVVQNGVGPAGLCFGGGFASGAPVQASCTSAGGSWVAAGVPAGKSAFAVMLRDAHVFAYNQVVEVRDPSVGPATSYNWSLVYTFGKLDGDFYFYPEGRGQGVALSTTATGLKADVTLAIQSPGYWDKANSASAAVRATAGAGWATNTHFMLADTAVGGNAAQQYGVGLVNADLLWRARDLYFRVIAGDSGYPSLPGGLWLQTDNVAQYRFRGLFGGGNLQDLSTPTSVGLLDLNLSANRFIFVLNPVAPVAGDAPVGFNGILDLDGTSYFSIAEVSSPSSSFRIYGLQGRVGWQGGRVNLISGQNTPDALPRLSINNDLLFGSSANFGDGGGAPLIGNVGFGSEYFGRMVLPSGSWHSDVTIKIPNS